MQAVEPQLLLSPEVCVATMHGHISADVHVKQHFNQCNPVEHKDVNATLTPLI